MGPMCCNCGAAHTSQPQSGRRRLRMPKSSSDPIRCAAHWLRQDVEDESSVDSVTVPSLQTKEGRGVIPGTDGEESIIAAHAPTVVEVVLDAATDVARQKRRPVVHPELGSRER